MTETQVVTPVKTLVVEKYDYGFRFFAKGSKTSWFVKQHNMKPGLFVLVEEENRQAVKIEDISYLYVNVRGLCELYVWVVTQPSQAVETITGKAMEIGEVLIEDYSEKTKDGFESCSFKHMIEPKGWE
jgi:hypothetical protein